MQKKNYEMKQSTASEICNNIEVQMNNSDSDVCHISDEDITLQTLTSLAKPQLSIRIF